MNTLPDRILSLKSNPVPASQDFEDPDFHMQVVHEIWRGFAQTGFTQSPPVMDDRNTLI
ncbi:MAG: hypothetical protein JXB85_16215 [Anaerolineales bacterium]|nr:hypothetical protein [Anaerolineales bacterium]